MPLAIHELRISDATVNLTKLIGGRPIEDYANSGSCFSLARKWIVECVSEHSTTCPYSTRSRMPTRVIDVGPTNSSKSPRLYLTKGRRGLWVALSHCWGPSCHFVTNTKNLGRRQKGIPVEDMPATFRDAIRVTRRLRYRYLWIESLCIVQDSQKDWAHEASQMANYYKNSILTLAADSASGDHEGFLETPHYHLGVISKQVGIRVAGDEHHLVYVTRREKSWEDVSELSKRAWTLQEDLLSPRTLRYTAVQLVWQCQARTYCESNVRGTKESRDIKRYLLNAQNLDHKVLATELRPEEFEPTYRWYNIIADYTQRSLTYHDDRLPAISGIAREISHLNFMTYKAGIWLENFSRGLAW